MINYEPRVSVGMPVYNGERWIREAVDSILGQTYRDLELVICDNASTDGTERICRDYAERDSRVRYYRNSENLGVNENYNCVFRHVRGRYFKWASSSDVCAKPLIERCVEMLEARADTVLCYGRTALFRERTSDAEDYDDGLDLQDPSACARLREFIKRMRLNNIMNGVVRTAVLRQTGLLQSYFSSDVVLFAELALRGKFVELPQRMFFRRMTAETATKLASADRLRDYFDPRRQRGMLFQHWKLHRGYFSAATRAPLPLWERACVYRHLLREAFWAHAKLMEDLRLAFRSYFDRGRNIA